MFDLQAIYDDFITDFDIYNLIRIVIIVGGYIFLRGIVSTELKKRQLKKQLESDRKKKLLAQGLVDNDACDVIHPEEGASGVQVEEEIIDDGSWGWGKKTRKEYNRKAKIFEETIKRELDAKQALRSEFNEDSDQDIADLLEDD
ncbi:hypothetical protein LJB42_000197 [Komagataella kurtzmanii]|nr:hypothetical protein LJB42_000197 [Komagataella kurtzmanii]